MVAHGSNEHVLCTLRLGKDSVKPLKTDPVISLRKVHRSKIWREECSKEKISRLTADGMYSVAK